MKRNQIEDEEGGSPASKKVKQSSDDEELVRLILDDDNDHLQGLLQSRTRQKLVTRFSFGLTNEQVIRTTLQSVECMDYSPKMGLILKTKSDFFVYDFKTRALSNILHDEYEELRDTFCIVEKDNAIIYCTEDMGLVKLDISSKEAIWRNERSAHKLVYYPKLNQILSVKKSSICILDATTGNYVGFIDLSDHKDTYSNAELYVDDDRVMVAIDFGQWIKLLVLKGSPLTISHSVLMKTMDTRFKRILFCSGCICMFNNGYSYNIETGRFLNRTTGIPINNLEISMIRNNRYFQFDQVQKSVTTFDIEFDFKEMLCPLGKKECDEVRRLCGSVPTFFQSIYGISDVDAFMYAVDWNSKDWFFLVEKERTMPFQITQFTRKKGEGIEIVMEQRDNCDVTLSNSVVHITMDHFCCNLPLTEFLSRLQKIDYTIIEEKPKTTSVIVANYQQIVDLSSPENMSEEDVFHCYRKLVMGDEYDEEEYGYLELGTVLKFLRSLSRKTIVVNGKRYSKADLVVIYFCVCSSWHNSIKRLVEFSDDEDSD